MIGEDDDDEEVVFVVAGVGCLMVMPPSASARSSMDAGFAFGTLESVLVGKHASISNRTTIFKSSIS